jgi:hypothetical protein
VTDALDGSIADAIERADLDELTRTVDRLCDARDWDGLVTLRDRCRAALERGRQVWPVASHAEYRLALEAPASHAALVLEPDTGHMAPGPLAEVAASTHSWAELAPHVQEGPIAALAAHERVVRGEVIERSVPYDDVLGVPLTLHPWEPEYAVARYRAEGGEFDAPGIAPRGRPLAPTARDATPHRDPSTEAALLDVVTGWTRTSEGHARAVGVEGDAAAAIAALDVADARAARLDCSEAIAWLAWAGAGGGRHGRRRGAAAGRDAAWAASAALAGHPYGEIVDADRLGVEVGALGWFWWSAPDAVTGHVLRLAVEDPKTGCAWALDAVDGG